VLVIEGVAGGEGHFDNGIVYSKAGLNVSGECPDKIVASWGTGARHTGRLAIRASYGSLAIPKASRFQRRGGTEVGRKTRDGSCIWYRSGLAMQKRRGASGRDEGEEGGKGLHVDKEQSMLRIVVELANVVCATSAEKKE
jgi:hypothetical protein